MVRRLCKIIVLGECGVGKSSTTIQFTQNHFVTEYDPTIENSYRKLVHCDEHEYMLDILDTAGEEERSPEMMDPYIASVEGFVGIYSITNKNSFKELVLLLERIPIVKDMETFPLAIAGNKCDLESERQITIEEGLQLAKRFNAPFFETTAKFKINIEELFYEVIQQIANSEHAGVSVRSATTSEQNIPTEKLPKKKCVIC